MNYKRLLASVLLFSIVISLCACSFIFGVKCPNCGEKCDSDMLYCPYCRAELTGSKKCSKGHENVDGAKYCAECGEPLGGSSNNNVENESYSDGDSLQDTSSAPIELNLILVESIEADNMSHKKIVTKYTYLSDGELFTATETTSWASTGEVISTKDIFFSTNGENVISSSCDGDVNYDVYNDDGVFLYRTRYSEVCSTDYESTQTNELADGGKEVICTKKLSNGETFTDVITYDQSGEMVKFTHNYRRNDSEREQQKGSICEYENGNMVRYYQIAPALSENPLLRAECRYDDNGCCIERKIYVGTYVLQENGKTMFLPPKYGLDNPQEAAASVTSFNYMPLEDYLEQKQSGSGYETGANSNTGANNGGTTTKGVACQWCEQTGKLDCSVCEGTGKVGGFDSKGNKIMKTCPYKDCFYGKEECYHCGGDGIYLND